MPGVIDANDWAVDLLAIQALSERFHLYDPSISPSRVHLALLSCSVATYVEPILVWVLFELPRGNGLLIGCVGSNFGIAGCNSGVAEAGIELE